MFFYSRNIVILFYYRTNIFKIKLNSFFEARLTRDLLYKSATGSTGGMYFNESRQAFDGVNNRQEFNFDMAYNQMHGQCVRRNNWEEKRIQTMKERGIIQ